MRQVFEARDEQSAAAIMNGQYTSMTILAEPQELYLRVEPEEIGRARLDRVVYHCTARAEVDPLQAVCVTLLLDGRLTYRQGRTEVDAGPNDVICGGDPGQPSGVAWTDITTYFLTFEPGLLDEVASTELGGPVAMLSHRPYSPGAAQSFSRFVRSLRAARTSEFEGANAPLVAAHTARLLAAATLATFPSNIRTDPTAVDRRDARPRALRRAMSFVESNPGRDITVDDLAAAAGVTPRAIQMAFRRHLGTTPTGFIRHVRLAHAHEDLTRADPAATTVSAVAHRWGFGNPSRFAARYRERFGESPGQTLRR